MKIKLLFPLLLITISSVSFHPQQMIKIETVTGDLANQFKAAFNKERSDGNFWIGYSILRTDEHQFLIGSSYFTDELNTVTLRDIIQNTEKYQTYNTLSNKIKNKKKHGRSISINDGFSIHHNKGTDRETALLFMYDKNSGSIVNFAEVLVCNLSLYVDLENHPVLWLGQKENKSSLEFLLELNKKMKGEFQTKELIPAIAIHTDQQIVTSFLKEIIFSNAERDLRECSVFWLGFQNNYDALDALRKIIKNEPLKDLRKEAVFGLSNIDLPEATDELITIARRNGDDELRKNAVYGLGNKSVKKAEDALKNIVETDPDIEIKKHAVYALANSSNNNVPYLIDIAKNHSSLSIRKCAIWSLSNSNDERALDALIALAKN